MFDCGTGIGIPCFISRNWDFCHDFFGDVFLEGAQKFYYRLYLGITFYIQKQGELANEPKFNLYE